MLVSHTQMLVEVLRVNDIQEHVIRHMKSNVLDQGDVTLDIVAHQNDVSGFTVGQPGLQDLRDCCKDVFDPNKLTCARDRSKVSKK